MADYGLDRITSAQRCKQLRQDAVLRLREVGAIVALELDADAEVVAALVALPARSAGMPSALETGDELAVPAIATDEEMCRDAAARQRDEIGVCGRIEPVGEQGGNGLAAKLPRRQADRVDDDQPDRRAGWSGIAIRAGDSLRAG